MSCANSVTFVCGSAHPVIGCTLPLKPASATLTVQASATSPERLQNAIDVLIAMNPAALKVNVGDLKANGILIVNSDSFKENDLRKAQVTSNPLEDHSLDKFRLFSVELERLTRRSLEHLGLDAKSMDRCKNFS